MSGVLKSLKLVLPQTLFQTSNHKLIQKTHRLLDEGTESTKIRTHFLVLGPQTSTLYSITTASVSSLNQGHPRELLVLSTLKFCTIYWVFKMPGIYSTKAKMPQLKMFVKVKNNQCITLGFGSLTRASLFHQVYC